MSMCISVKKFQRTKFDVSQKPLIQKMHTEPEILNRGIEGYDAGSELPLADSPASTSLKFIEKAQRGGKAPTLTHTMRT